MQQYGQAPEEIVGGLLPPGVKDFANAGSEGGGIPGMPGMEGMAPLSAEDEESLKKMAGECQVQ